MEKLKVILAWLALASMAVFVAAVGVGIVRGSISQVWYFLPLTLFLVFGALSLLIRWTQEKLKEKRELEKQAAEEAKEKQA